MKKYFVLGFCILIFFSCSARKVAVSKSDTKIYTESKSVVTKDSVSVTQNAIVVKETMHEMDIVPFDTSKPVIIGETKYYNAIIRFKKKDSIKVDSSKIIVSQVINSKNTIKQESNTNNLDKKIDKKSNYFFYLWLLLIPFAAYIIIRNPLK